MVECPECGVKIYTKEVGIAECSECGAGINTKEISVAITERVPLEQYAIHYDFSVGQKTTGEQLWALEQETKHSPFRARRKALAKSLPMLRVEIALGAEPIQIPIDGHYHGGLLFYTCPKDLYIGGLFREVEVCKSHSDDYDLSVELCVYTGPLPPWVAEKAKVAANYVDWDRILVVSRDKTLFDVEPVLIQRRSPLLVIYWHANRQSLLAAWGLEHELPKSLGGLLEG